MQRLLFVFIITTCLIRVSGQDVFKTNVEPEEKQAGLFLNFENASFFKNNEFKSDVVEGYTLTGAWLRSKLVFRPSEKVQLELGYNYLKYNGAQESSWSLPWFSARVKLSEGWQFILGNLNNSHNHRLISPIWEPERFLTDKPEAGFQFLHNSENLYFDAWLNWEQFITKGDPFQEHFAAGISAELNLLKSGRATISMPLQMLAYHKGGEIDSSPLPVQTLINIAGGLKGNLSLNGFFQNLNLAGYYTGFKDLKGHAGLPFENGSGFWGSTTLETKAGEIGFGYWASKKFYAIKGKQLLQVVGEDFTQPESFNPKKNMFSVFYDFRREIYSGINFGFRFDAWFEPGQKYFSNMAALYIVVNQEFLLRRLD